MVKCLRRNDSVFPVPGQLFPAWPGREKTLTHWTGEVIIAQRAASITKFPVNFPVTRELGPLNGIADQFERCNAPQSKAVDLVADNDAE